MYGYEEYIDISPEQVLQKVTQEQIIEFILKEKLVLGQAYTSPFRDDKHPKCRFELLGDKIIFIDFGELNRTGRTHRNCFGMVQDRYGVDLTGAIRIICNTFSISKTSQDYEPITITEYEKPLLVRTQISYERKPYIKADVLEWSKYLIKIEELKEDNTFSVARYRLKGRKGQHMITPYRYCYAFDFIDKVKLYQPYAADKYRFISSCDENCIGNFDNLPHSGKRLIVQKSYKDHRVVRNTIRWSNVIWLQNEGCVPDLSILAGLVNRFEEIVVFFDNDEGGALAAIKLVNIFNQLRPGCARMVHLPTFVSRQLTWKDPAQFVNKEGRSDLITVFKQLDIYDE